jgi:cbb3-type cytochrome oxidase subunit 3
MVNQAEFYFVAGMMVLILIICAVAVYAFFRTYKKEQADREREKRHIERNKQQVETEVES